MTVEDIETESTREKIEFFKSYYFVTYCTLDRDPKSSNFMQSFNIYILIYSNFILTFHFPSIDFNLTNIARRLDSLKEYLRLTPHWINYAFVVLSNCLYSTRIIDDVTDEYLPFIHAIEMEVDSIDDLVLLLSETEQADMLRRIANARKRVVDLHRALVLKTDVLRGLMKRLELRGRDTFVYLEDVQDRK